MENSRRTPRGRPRRRRHTRFVSDARAHAPAFVLAAPRVFQVPLRKDQWWPSIAQGPWFVKETIRFRSSVVNVAGVTVVRPLTVETWYGATRPAFSRAGARPAPGRRLR